MESTDSHSVVPLRPSRVATRVDRSHWRPGYKVFPFAAGWPLATPSSDPAWRTPEDNLWFCILRERPTRCISPRGGQSERRLPALRRSLEDGSRPGELWFASRTHWISLDPVSWAIDSIKAFLTCSGRSQRSRVLAIVCKISSSRAILAPGARPASNRVAACVVHRKELFLQAARRLGFGGHPVGC